MHAGHAEQGDMRTDGARRGRSARQQQQHERGGDAHIHLIAAACAGAESFIHPTATASLARTTRHWPGHYTSRTW